GGWRCRGDRGPRGGGSEQVVPAWVGERETCSRPVGDRFRSWFPFRQTRGRRGDGRRRGERGGGAGRGGPACHGLGRRRGRGRRRLGGGLGPGRGRGRDRGRGRSRCRGGGGRRRGRRWVWCKRSRWWTFEPPAFRRSGVQDRERTSTSTSTSTSRSRSRSR